MSAYNKVGNIKGPKGDKGDPGTAGTNGTNGTAGSRGPGWSQGSGAPTSTTGVIVGDLYLDTATGDVYQYS